MQQQKLPPQKAITSLPSTLNPKEKKTTTTKEIEAALETK